jgi:protocatechuate 3,4-dioxygenase beta subunit
MIGKKLTKISIIGVFAFCFLLQVNLAGGDDGIHSQVRKKCNVPMEIELYFSSTPMLNENTVLSIEITTLRDAPNTQIDIELPREGLKLISGSTQFNEDLSSGSTAIYSLEVLPVAFGQYKIAVNATSEEADFIFGKREELYVNINEGFSELSKSSFIAEVDNHRSEATKIGSLSEPPAQVPLDQKPIEGQEILYFAAPDPNHIMVKGYWYYQNRDGANRPLRDARVEIWDADSSDDTGDDLLGTIYTNNSGYYASDNISNDDEEGGGQDIYVKVFATDDRAVRVTDFSTSNNLYYFATPVRNNVADGDVDVGIYTLDDANNRKAWYIYDLIANDAFDYLANNAGWQNLSKLQVRWSPTSSQGTYYRPGASIDLVAGDGWDSDVFLHEYGHFVMYKIYGNYLPPSPNCSSHFWGKHSSLGCAWTEGWANFLQAAIQNDKFYDDTEDQRIHIDVELPSPSADHAEDEGGVAASLWDIFDPVSATEAWDDIGNGINGSSNNGIWSIVSGDEPEDFIEFYGHWISSSNGHDSEVTTILQHHQIDPDITRPVVAITGPTSGSTFVTGSSPLSIGGTASDNKAVTVVSWKNNRGGSGNCSGTSNWSKTGIVLYSGQNVITVTARDAAGNTATDTLTVTYTPPDTTKPKVTIGTPTSGTTYSTSNSQLSMGGTASDNKAVTVVSWKNNRGGSGNCSGTSNWSKTGIALYSGQNVITVTARDAAGNTATDTLTVTYTPPDTTKPTVAISKPTSGSTHSTGSSQLSISGTASDNKAVTLVSWKNSRGGSGNCSGTSGWSKVGIVLYSGQNVITVTARDAAGNTAADSLTVTYTPPDTTKPTVVISTPTSNSTYSTGSSKLSIGGTASDNKAVTVVSWKNSRGGSGNCSGTSSWSKTGIALYGGQNVITVTARDAAGNTATDTLTVTYTPPDTTKPTVAIGTPTGGSTYSTGSSPLSIGGSASDNKTVTFVSWKNSQGGSGNCSGTNSWSKTGIALYSGQNVITVTARDAAGNTATDTLTVTYTPPDTTPDPDPTPDPDIPPDPDPTPDPDTPPEPDPQPGQDTPPEIIEEESYPHDAQGMDEDTLRVPNDTSIVARIQNDEGVDDNSVRMKIANLTVDIRVQQVNDGDDTDYWIIHAPKTLFTFEQAVDYSIDAKNVNGVEMDTYYASFKIESEGEHDAALAETPSSAQSFDDPVIGQNTIAADLETVIEGAKIIYDNIEPVAPRFGPLGEIPDLDIEAGVGTPLNMQPANVVVNPVTVFIPCPGETDLGTLEIYVYNPAIGWQASWETDGCIVPGSRVNHGPNDPEPTEPPTIEVQLNHFSAVQAGKPAELISPSAGAGDENVAEKAASGGGGGGGCFITATAGASEKLEIDLAVFLLLLILGLIGFLGIRRTLKK